MGYDDLVRASGGGRRVAIEVQADDGSWLDLNSIAPSSVPDYWGGLLQWPRPRIQTQEAGRIVAASSDDLTLDNAPILDDSGGSLVQGHAFGLFDAPLPVVIRGKRITSWIGKKVRFSRLIWDANGQYVDTDSMATFRIRNVSRKNGRARVILVNVLKGLEKKPAETIKAGSRWYGPIPIGAALYLVLKRSNPSLSVDPAIQTAFIDQGVLSTEKVSSWGSIPGCLSSGEPSIHSGWIARAFARDISNADNMFVGCETYTGQSNASGGIVIWSAKTGRFTIQAYPSQGGLTGRFPIAMHTDATYVWWAAFEEADPTGFLPFAKISIYRVQKYVNFAPTQIMAPRSFWPCRDVYRKGIQGTDPSEDHRVWFGQPPGAGAGWFGESPCLPFTQNPDIIGDIISPSTPLGSSTYVSWVGLKQSAYESGQTGHIRPIDPVPRGFVGGEAYYSATQGPGFAAFKHALHTHRMPPICMKQGSEFYFYWLFLNPDPANLWFGIGRIKVSGSSPYNYEYWTLKNMGIAETQLWSHQAIAFAYGCGITDGTRVFYVATMEWSEVRNPSSIPWSTCSIRKINASGASGSDATAALVWYKTPTSDSDALTIVFMHTPYKTDYHEQQTEAFCVCVVLNRGDMSGQPFGIGVFKESGGVLTWISQFPSTNYSGGPVSGMPFAAFATDPADSTKVTFSDEATGQRWQVSVDATNSTASYSLLNDGAPGHGTELAASSALGMSLVGTDGYARTLYGGAPGIPGELQHPWFTRSGFDSSRIRRTPGIFPLLMSSRVVADVIEQLDLSGLMALDTIRQICDLAPKYVPYVDEDEVFRFDKNVVGPDSWTLVPVSKTGYADILNDEIPYDDGFDVSYGIDEVENACDVKPYGPVPQENPQPRQVRGPKSEWGGTSLVEIHTDQPIRIALTCVVGGDIRTPTAGGTTPILMRYARVGETIHAYLAAPCSETSSVIDVAGIEVIDLRPYSGGTEIKVGDWIEVKGSARAAITVIDGAQGNGCRLRVQSGIGVNAVSFEEVVIYPNESRSVSDHPDGLTNLLLAVGDTVSEEFRVSDPTVVAPGMIIQIDAEKLLVKRIGSDRIWMSRGAAGSTAATHAAGAPLLGWIAIREPGRLYDVGNTGVRIGLDIDADQDDQKLRTISVGDAVLIQTGGYALEELKNATQKALDADSIDDHGRQGKPYPDNRFIDLLRAKLLADTRVAERKDPPVIVTGLRCPNLPSVRIGQQALNADRRIVPTSTPVPFKIFAIDYPTPEQMVLSIRSIGGVPGAGKRGVSIATRGSGLPKEMEEQRT